MRTWDTKLIALGVVAVWACGSSERGAVSTAGDHCAGVVAAMAEVTDRCLGAPASTITATQAQVTAQWADKCRSLAGDAAASRLSYDAAKGAACVDALRSVACSALAGTFPPLRSGPTLLDDAIWTVLFGPPTGMMAPSPLDGTTLSVCEGVLAGRVPVGGACSATIQCAGGWCEGAIDESSIGGVCPGTCALLPGEGEACAGGRTRCAAGLACHEEPLPGPFHGVTLVCRRIAGAGETCQVPTTSGRCASGSFCDAATAVCAPVADVGGPCSFDAGCRPDLWCNSSGTCAATSSDGPCNGSGCAMGSFCDVSSGTCRTIPGPGAPCTPTPSTNWTCVDGFYCDPASSRCVGFPTLGDTCSVDVGCRPGFCDASTATCAALRPEGAACDPQGGVLCQGRDSTCDPGTRTCTSLACALP